MERPFLGYLRKITYTLKIYKDAVMYNLKSTPKEKDDQKIINSIHHAIEEWYTAQQFFENVSEPELVDYAVYNLEASRKKYIYLLKKAKDMGVKADCK